MLPTDTQEDEDEAQQQEAHIVAQNTEYNTDRITDSTPDTITDVSQDQTTTDAFSTARYETAARSENRRNRYSQEVETNGGNECEDQTTRGPPPATRGNSIIDRLKKFEGGRGSDSTGGDVINTTTSRFTGVGRYRRPSNNNDEDTNVVKTTYGRNREARGNQESETGRIMEGNRRQREIRTGRTREFETGRNWESATRRNQEPENEKEEPDEKPLYRRRMRQEAGTRNRVSADNTANDEHDISVGVTGGEIGVSGCETSGDGDCRNGIGGVGGGDDDANGLVNDDNANGFVGGDDANGLVGVDDVNGAVEGDVANGLSESANGPGGGHVNGLGCDNDAGDDKQEERKTEGRRSIAKKSATSQNRRRKESRNLRVNRPGTTQVKAEDIPVKTIDEEERIVVINTAVNGGDLDAQDLDLVSKALKSEEKDDGYHTTASTTSMDDDVTSADVGIVINRLREELSLKDIEIDELRREVRELQRENNRLKNRVDS